MKKAFKFFILSVQLVAISLLSASELPKPLVETDWLAQNLEKVSILDVRSSKKSFTNEPVFTINKKTGKKSLTRVGGHIPGASLVLYKNVRGDKNINGSTVKHMVPDKSTFEKLMQKAGMNQDSNIVVVTNAESTFDLTMAARMYWQLKYFGHDNVSILNGGTSQWLTDGHKIAKEHEDRSQGNWRAQEERAELFASSEEVMGATTDSATQLVDVRPLGQYLGTYKSSKVKAKGHIPTAKSYPIDLTSKRNSPVKFSSVSELGQVTNALGVNLTHNIITYCNSGHMASGGWFVLYELLGNKNTKLYDGSMHQWTAEQRPVVTMKIE